MRVTRRRARRLNEFATPERVRAILNELREMLPQVTPRGEKQMIAMLRAARHVERYPATDTKRGRPSPWRRIDLIQLASAVREVLDRITGGRISLSSFVDHYLRTLDFPPDVLDSLMNGDVNLFEAEQLARVSAGRLEISPAEAREKRAEVLQAHLLTRSSGTRLRLRLNEMLGEGVTTLPGYAKEFDDPDILDPSDTTHLFYDEMRRLAAALKQIRPEDLNNELLEELLRASDGLWNVLTRIQKRKTPAASAKNRLTI